MSSKSSEARQQMAAEIRAHVRSFAWRSHFQEWVLSRLDSELHQSPFIEELDSHVGVPRAQIRILDVGCGMGGLLTACALHGFGSCIGIDPRLNYLRISRLRAVSRQCAVSVVQGIGEALPFRDSSFEAFACVDVIEHARFPDALLRELRRIVRPTGGGIITVPSRFMLIDTHYHLPFVAWLPGGIADSTVKILGRQKTDSVDLQRLSTMHYFSSKSFRKLAGDCGFVAEDIRLRRLLSGSFGGLLNTRWAAASRLVPVSSWLARTVFEWAQALRLANYVFWLQPR